MLLTSHWRWRRRKIGLLAILIAGATACAPFRQYRTAYEICASSTRELPKSCDASALQDFSLDDGSRFLMGFVEFDDQGVLWSRDQLRAVENQLIDMSSADDLLMVVFVHGWKHNADPSDDNITTFRNVLADLAAAELRLSHATEIPARKVVGIYLGWRGASVPIPWIENLTFWNRKDTAERVGHGGVTEVLSRLQRIRRIKDATSPSKTSRTRLVVVGHSFGGAVVATALSQLLENRFVDTAGEGVELSDVVGFGNLVVLINPAFEGVLFAPLSDMAAERGTYFPSQLPVMVVMTSEADYATRYAFPAGRWLGTLFEKMRKMERTNALTRQSETIDEGDAAITAVGHFEPYRTHWLHRADERPRSEIAQMPADESVRVFLQSSDAWAKDAPGSRISFGNLVMERTDSSAGRNPYLVIRVDRHLIRDHNDISDPRIIDFVKQIILLSTHSTEEAAQMRRAMTGTPE